MSKYRYHCFKASVLIVIVVFLTGGCSVGPRRADVQSAQSLADTVRLVDQAIAWGATDALERAGWRNHPSALIKTFRVTLKTGSKTGGGVGGEAALGVAQFKSGIEHEYYSGNTLVYEASVKAAAQAPGSDKGAASLLPDHPLHASYSRLPAPRTGALAIDDPEKVATLALAVSNVVTALLGDRTILGQNHSEAATMTLQFNIGRKGNLEIVPITLGPISVGGKINREYSASHEIHIVFQKGVRKK